MISALACMAVAIYFEARAEPLAGQIAVANVVINRVIDVSPVWAKTMTRIVRIENHIFYKGIEMREKKNKGFQPDSARKGGRKSMLMHQGFPDYIKNKDARELHIAKAMKGQRYQDVRFKQPLNKVINWNQVQKLNRTQL